MARNVLAALALVVFTGSVLGIAWATMPPIPVSSSTMTTEKGFWERVFPDGPATPPSWMRR